MKITRTITVTRVERTVVVKAAGRCPHCGAELPPAEGPPAAAEEIRGAGADRGTTITADDSVRESFPIPVTEAET
jgi:hypothetical protein